MLDHTWDFEKLAGGLELKLGPITQLPCFFVDFLPHKVFRPLAQHDELLVDALVDDLGRTILDFLLLLL